MNLQRQAVVRRGLYRDGNLTVARLEGFSCHRLFVADLDGYDEGDDGDDVELSHQGKNKA